jgi:hypothetical protein
MPSSFVSALSRALSIVVILSPLIACSSNGDSGVPGGMGGETGGSGGDATPDAGSVGTGGEGAGGPSTGSGTGGDSTATPDPNPDSGSAQPADAGQNTSDSDGFVGMVTPVPEAGVDLSSTQAILDSRGAGCFSCAQVNGCLDPDQSGGTCETLAGNALSGVTEKSLCLKTLNDIFVSQCNAMLLIIDHCACGPVDVTACTGGIVAPVGPVYEDYAADYGNDIGKIVADFETLTFGAGVANVVAECVGLYGCPCQ